MHIWIPRQAIQMCTHNIYFRRTEENYPLSYDAASEGVIKSCI